MGVSVEKGVHGSHCVRPSSPTQCGRKTAPLRKRGPQAVIPVGLAVFKSHDLFQPKRYQFAGGPGTCDAALHQELYAKRDDDNWVASQTLPQDCEWKMWSESAVRRHKGKKKLRPAELQKGKALGEETLGPRWGAWRCVWGGHSHPDLSWALWGQAFQPLALSVEADESILPEFPKDPAISWGSHWRHMSHHPNPW